MKTKRNSVIFECFPPDRFFPLFCRLSSRNTFINKQSRKTPCFPLDEMFPAERISPYSLVCYQAACVNFELAGNDRRIEFCRQYLLLV